MNVNYTSKEIRSPLATIKYGAVFRPHNSSEIFIKTCGSGNDDLFNDCESRLMEYYENLQGNTYNTPSELILCVSPSGELVLFHRYMEVVELNATLMVEE